MKQGLLLINLGTPEQPTQAAVRSYLKEFLSDPRVITLPAPIRYILLYGLILPFRPKKSARAYQAIWTQEGSPLLLHSQALQKRLQSHLGESFQVELAMRYGKPSIEEALQRLQACSAITVLPLYPQYSSAATGSILEKIFSLLKSKPVMPALTIIRDFYNHPAYIKAQAELIAPYLEESDFILFSYHGLPQLQLKQGGCKHICTSPCENDENANLGCYRSQCFITSRLLSQALDLPENKTLSAFQSRLGKAPWIKPYTEEVLTELAKRGIKRLTVVCPSFTADCLETLEEIGIRGKQAWLNAGGLAFNLVPSLNDELIWIKALKDIIS